MTAPRQLVGDRDIRHDITPERRRGEHDPAHGRRLIRGAGGRRVPASFEVRSILLEAGGQRAAEHPTEQRAGQAGGQRARRGQRGGDLGGPCAGLDDVEDQCSTLEAATGDGVDLVESIAAIEVKSLVDRRQPDSAVLFESQ